MSEILTDFFENSNLLEIRIEFSDYAELENIKNNDFVPYLLKIIKACSKNKNL